MIAAGEQILPAEVERSAAGLLRRAEERRGHRALKLTPSTSKHREEDLSLC